MELGKARNENITVHEVTRELELPVDRDEAWEAVADPEVELSHEHLRGRSRRPESLP